MTSTEVQHRPTAPPLPTCPRWCELPAGHLIEGVELEFNGTVTRFHEVTVGLDPDVRIRQLERVQPDASVARQPVFISIDDESEVLTSAQAYQLGDRLVAAARQLEQITAAGL